MRTRIEISGPVERPRVLLTEGAVVPRRIRSAGGGHRVALVAGQALLLAGDQVRIEVAVAGPHLLHLVETGGTVAYDMRGGSASWDVHLELRDRAQVRWHAEPFVVADGADVVRMTDADLEHGCRLALRERLVFGRTGETGGTMRTRTRIDLGSAPVLAEDLDLSPRLRGTAAILGPHRCFDSVTILGERLADGPGVLQAEGVASVARWFGADLHCSDLDEVWSTSAIAVDASAG